MAMRSRDEGKAQPVSVFSGRHDRRKVTDWVYEELKSAIVDLRLAPGDPLREATLAEQLGVSKTPIREALTRLEQEGLVETTSFKGAVVSGYSRQDLIEIYELRELLENAAARAAAESMSDEDRDRLRRICRESRKLTKGGDAAGLAALISAFDDVLFDHGPQRPDPRADREPAGSPDPDRSPDRGDPGPDRGVGRRAREDPRSDRRPRPLTWQNGR
jgi:DNA-binding transcriptional regulator YhcF (GntR family)